MRSAKQVGRVAGIFAMAMMLAVGATAQTFTGGVRGAVRDANGVIPGVTVQLVNEGTGQTREAVTNEQGEYNFSAVPPSNYTVKATLTGFRTYENRNVRVGAQQFVTLDILLEVGALQETITVTGAAPLIDTSNASTGAVIDSAALQALPSAGRSAFLFAVTVPTVIASGDGQFNRQQDQTSASLLSLGGGTRRGNNYLIDGVPITDLRNRASANPSIEALEDVAVQVHTYDAETGRTGGGIFNTATKSGTNDWHGSGFYQTRPRWGMSNNFFSQRRGNPLPETYFHTGGGAVGGPIVRNRTFFWFSTEGYGSNTTRNESLRLPTARERAGDFSQTFIGGQLQVVYDPLTGDPATGLGRQPFPGNVIPQNRLNPIAVAMQRFLPLPDSDVSNGANNYSRTAEIVDTAMMYTGKVDHRFSDSVSLSGFYLYNKTDEPCANTLYPGLNDPNRFIDRNDYLLLRRVNVLALNNTWLPSNNTVATLRFGWTRFIDDDTLSIDFDPAQLGFSQTFLGQMQVKKFPRVSVSDYYNMGAIDPTPRNWYSWSANGTVSRLYGRHTLKVGADYRTIGIDTQSFSGGAGDFRFDRLYTSANPLTVSNANGGNAWASFLMGYMSGDPGNYSRLGVSQPFNAFVNYYGAYAQDDFRINAKTTLNFGLRLEHETGLMEENNSFTVAFDRTLNPGGALGNVVNPITGQRIVGGLVYAGVNGANEYQGDPPALKVSPRIGLVHSFNPKTVLRTGYGIYWAPWNYQSVSSTNYGNIGFSNTTFTSTQNQFRPTLDFANPFPNGIIQPSGSSLGALAGVGSNIDFIDQNKKAPYVHQYSIDVNRELPGNMAIGFEYSGASGRDLGLGGSNDGIININQLDPRHMALGSALLESVPNPFFGLPAGQGFNVTSATVQRRQLLRPFPQFGDILMRQSTLGRNQYHAGIVKFEKRLTNGWGGRVNYTYSRLEDNQFGESNFFSRNSTEAQNAYDLDDEYSVGILDVPHKIVMAPIFQLPFGEGRRWANSGAAAWILGDWTLSSIITIESGFPIQVATSTNNTQIFSRMQRANPGSGPRETSGSDQDRYEPGLWLNPAGFSLPAAFTFGSLPRTISDLRTPARNNVDFVASKDLRWTGRVRSQLRLEVINLTNTPKVRGPIHTLGSSTFGSIGVQSGFMRMTQIMFRTTF
jgi:trimeric autotransporter adhesin